MAPRLTVLRETISKSLPSTVAVGTDTIDPVELVWMLEPPAKLPTPAWLVGITDPVDVTTVADAFEAQATIESDVEDEAHTYEGEAITVLQQQDVGEVLSVAGFVDGNAYTFEEGVDFELVDSNADNAKDGLKWLDGGEKPDLSTQLIVSYTQILLQTERSRLQQVEVMIHIVAALIPADSRGASVDYRATEVMEALIGQAKQLIEGTLRPALEAQDFTLDLNVKTTGPFKMKGTDLLQYQQVLSVFYQEDVTVGQPVEVARSIFTDQTTVEYHP